MSVYAKCTSHRLLSLLYIGLSLQILLSNLHHNRCCYSIQPHSATHPSHIPQPLSTTAATPPLTPTLTLFRSLGELCASEKVYHDLYGSLLHLITVRLIRHPMHYRTRHTRRQLLRPQPVLVVVLQYGA